jgi:hypothetical protein
MKKHSFIGFLFFTQSVFSQETPATFWDNRCDFKTDGSGKSMGLKIKISFPCLWKHVEGEHPHVVRRFSYGLKEAISLVQTLTIDRFPKEQSQVEKEYFFSEKGFKELAGKTGTYISGRKITIDGLDCSEITTKIKREHPLGTFYGYLLQYYIIYKDKLILIAFAINSKSDESSKSAFELYRPLFQGIAGTTIVLSKWE